MSMKQPMWKCVAQLGDANPLEYGGLWVFVDTTGVYAPEMEHLDVPDSEEYKIRTVSRVMLDKCTYIAGILSDNEYHPEHAAWFASRLHDMAQCNGISEQELIKQFCSDDAIERACAYRVAAEYYGYHEFDHYALQLDEKETEARYSNSRYVVVK